MGLVMGSVWVVANMVSFVDGLTMLLLSRVIIEWQLRGLTRGIDGGFKIGRGRSAGGGE